MVKLNPEILVLLINLDRAQKRRFEMESQLSKFGIDYVRICAFDGKSYRFTAREYDESKYRRCVGRKTSPGEVCCYLSHYSAISRFLESGRKYALILEDDAVFNPDFVEILNRLVELCNTWDFVKFNTARDGGFGNVAVGDVCKNYKLYASLFQKSYAAAYIINRRAGESLKSGLLPMFVPFDHEMLKFWKYGIRQYSVFPSPVSVKDEDSYIGTYGKKSLNFPWYRRSTVLFYRIYMQLNRLVHFRMLLKRGGSPKHEDS